MNENILNLLKDIGLTQREAEVYIALLKMGKSSVLDISKNVKIHRTNIYDNLENLIEMGLAKFIVENDKKYYSITHPNMILEVLNERKLRFKDILPGMISEYSKEKSKTEASILRGKDGLKSIFEDYLRVKETIYMYGVPLLAPDLIKYYLPGYHKRRIKKKITNKVIFNYNAKNRMKFINSLNYSKGKYLPKEFDSPASTTIYGQNISIILWTEDPLIVSVKNKQIAESYKSFFDFLWKIAKK
ncbi:hypothetical protein HOD20_03450 [archaeon]|jgi:HTH-type transcriptional regulator, sugar sensing transcriptional regulator|nr:hypothetical protein [archaeon]MBT4351557.1 hypothetical protein [archaeon]MBT4647111.1 hypothetical protein [archaeon]MBT6821101.1 hypothetical protein [archaeon]MBT7392189.1 hypothetical protein [archaeon]